MKPTDAHHARTDRDPGFDYPEFPVLAISTENLKAQIKSFKRRNFKSFPERQIGFNYAMWLFDDWIKFLDHGPDRKPPRKTKAEGPEL